MTQLGMFDDDFDDIDAPILAECICPRCRTIRIEDGIMPGVRRLRILCYDCKQLEDGSEARLPTSDYVPRSGVSVPEVTIYLRGAIPEELLQLYRRT